MKHHPRRIYSTGNPDTDRMIQKLLEEAGRSQDADFLKEIIITALKMSAGDIERGDIKMMNSAMKELRYALKIFYPYRFVRKVAIFGSARTPKAALDYKIARQFAKEIAKSGWMVITGASSGIMQAGNEGAGRQSSFGVNIRLPFEQRANPVIANDAKLINFKYFFTRKLIFIRESDATVLLPGGFGTHDEGFETLTLIQTGKTPPRPVVCLDPPKSNYWKAWLEFLKHQLVKRKMVDQEDLGIICFSHDPAEAARQVTRFYHNYQSMRYIGERLVIRMKRPLSRVQLDRVNQHFKDLVAKGKFQQHAVPFYEEINEPHTHDLTRLVFHFKRRNFARLYVLIDTINET